MESADVRPRRQVYVNRVIQGRMLRRFVVMWFVYHLVLWHAMFLYRYLQYRGELLAGAAPQPFADLYTGFLLTHYSLLICALAVLPVLMWDMTRTSHRIAGPLVRFQRALSELAEGRRVDPVQIRKGDLLLEFQDAFNEFLERIDMLKRPGRDDSDGEPRVTQPDRDDEVLRELRDVQASVARTADAPDSVPARS
jgi:hypothetical protein